MSFLIAWVIIGLIQYSHDTWYYLQVRDLNHILETGNFHWTFWENLLDFFALVLILFLYLLLWPGVMAHDIKQLNQERDLS